MFRGVVAPQEVLKRSIWRIYTRFVITKKMFPRGLHLAYRYAKYKPRGDIFLVFTKRIYICLIDIFSTPLGATTLLNTFEIKWFLRVLGIPKPQETI